MIVAVAAAAIAAADAAAAAAPAALPSTRQECVLGPLQGMLGLGWPHGPQAGGGIGQSLTGYAVLTHQMQEPPQELNNTAKLATTFTAADFAAATLTLQVQQCQLYCKHCKPLR